MCGIAGGYAPAEVVAAGTDALAHRGPDGAGLVTLGALTLGHRRLAIMDPTPASDQPYHYGNTAVVFNGEVWNYATLREELHEAGSTFTTTGDTEVLAALLDRDGPAGLSRLDAMAGFAWTSDQGETLHVARDPYGEVPLHWGYRSDGGVVFASEVRALVLMGALRRSIRWVPPGHVLSASAGRAAVLRPYDPEHDLSPSSETLEEAAPVLRSHLEHALDQRSMSDVGVTALVSGGIDSSAVLALLKQHHPDVVAYTAVYDRKSPDLKYSRVVCDALGVKLVEVNVPPPTIDDLAGIVRTIEMPHKTQVEISWPCIALAKAIREDGGKVVFSGEGSDELWASYARSYHRVQRYGWHQARFNEFTEQHRKNFARVNKIFMAEGIEARMPFLDPGLVRHGLRLEHDAVFGIPPTGGAQETRWKEKGVLRAAVADLLPAEIVRRNKAAFQTTARIPEAAEAVVAAPQAFYRAEYARGFNAIAS